jgi:peptidyl-prolyl cis-trans isomerase D
MLQKIRDNSQGVGAKIFVWFIIIVFGAWGASTIVSSVLTSNPAVSVNGVDIDELQVEQNTQRRIQEQIEALGPDADLSSIDEESIRATALDELIQRELLLQAAERAGMVVSSRSIDRGIAQTPDFQIDGVFNAERAQLVLQSIGYTPNSYRAALASEGLINQTTFTLGLSGFVTPNEIRQLAGLLNESRDIRYLLINMDDQLISMEVTDEEILAYYETNQARFMKEEQVSLEYLELDKDAIFDEVTVTEEQISRRYEEEQLEFQSQIERRASHILLEAFDDEGYEQALGQARELKTRIDNGESFVDLAAEYSDDLGSAEDGGDVGYTTGQNFVEEFEQALRELEVGQVSDPVRTEFGIHLVKLTEQSESAIESFADSRERIERDLKTTQVDTIFLERSEELGNLAFESFDLQDPAEIMGLELKTTGLFGRSGGTGIAANRDVINAAFGSDVLLDGLNSNLISLTPSRSVVVRLLQHNQPELETLDDVREEIRIELQFEKVSERAAELGRTITSSLQNGGNIDTILEAQDLTWSQLNELERNSQQLPPELVDNVFGMSEPAADTVNVEGFQLASGAFVVVELQKVNPGTIEDFEEAELASLTNFLEQQQADSELGAMIIGLQNRADIKR